jgi:hypothetical protein
MSGVAETLVKGGHMIEYETCLGLEGWLTTDQSYGPTILKCVQRTVIAKVAQYNEVLTATTNGHILTEPSREPVLCRAAAL